jgi:drug/metabolite transporter (DMT)-like permease
LSLGPATAGAAEALGAMLVLGSAVFAALAQVFIRKLVATEGTAAIVLWFSVSASGLALVTLPFGWVWPSPRLWVLLVTTGLLGGVGQILLTAAYRQADASLIAPFDYASMLFALLIGWFVFAEMPTATMLAGAAIVVLAGILIIWRERWLGLERARQRKAMTP